ncbi:hypothetical protein IRT45_05970 [Nocardia sp. BSTN01]|uniref:hypothetical protein n=1 Tax=Nocardia sp. BSTN01 TaxID=2783665 RepID=UPI001890398F|nr:hypothetical protein [Nocardia sp. BSTN01]MBF4996701.1 hypothetical protein [Nocardia sp. BSTN01]
MNKIQLEIRVNEIVDYVVNGGKVEDDWTEAKGAWPEPKNAGQLAGMANASGGHPILWIVGLSENRHKVIELDEDVDPNTWWMQIRAEFAHEVAPLLTVLRVATDHGPVFALQFETDQAPYLMKIQRSGWATTAVPWREGTGLRSATRAELLSILAPSAAVPNLDLIHADATLFGPAEAKIPEVGVLSLGGAILIDTLPGRHVLFPKHRYNVTVVAPTGERFEVRAGGVEFSTSAEVRPRTGSTIFAERRPSKAINPYGASEQPAGLVVLAPDVVTWRIKLGIMMPSAVPLDGAAWIEVALTLPISSTRKAAVLRFRLTRCTNLAPTAPPSMKPVTSWSSEEMLTEDRDD